MISLQWRLTKPPLELGYRCVYTFLSGWSKLLIHAIWCRHSLSLYKIGKRIIKSHRLSATACHIEGRNRNSCIFIQENPFENVIWEMEAILSRSQRVLMTLIRCMEIHINDNVGDKWQYQFSSLQRIHRKWTNEQNDYFLDIFYLPCRNNVQCWRMQLYQVALCFSILLGPLLLTRINSNPSMDK